MMSTAQSSKIEQYLIPGKRAHLVGIGGVSMRPLGLVLRSMGMQVTGSDMNASVSTDELIAKGIHVCIGHSAENIADADCVIRTAAAHNDNPEIAAARARGIPIFERAQAWGYIMRSYRHAVCVAGTHGKTTTTSMLTHIFMQAGKDPTVMIGGYLPLLHASHRVGHGDGRAGERIRPSVRVHAAAVRNGERVPILRPYQQPRHALEQRIFEIGRAPCVRGRRRAAEIQHFQPLRAELCELFDILPKRRDRGLRFLVFLRVRVLLGNGLDGLSGDAGDQRERQIGFQHSGERAVSEIERFRPVSIQSGIHQRALAQRILVQTAESGVFVQLVIAFREHHGRMGVAVTVGHPEGTKRQRVDAAQSGPPRGRFRRQDAHGVLTRHMADGVGKIYPMRTVS